LDFWDAFDKPRLLKQGDFRASVLSEAAIEGHDLVSSDDSERGEIGIAPLLRRELRMLGELSPNGFQALRLVGEFDAWICEKRVEQPPGFDLRHRCLREYLAIIGEPQKTLLRKATKVTPGALRQGVKSKPRGLMLRVCSKSQGQPDIDVKKMHSRIA
jgi:hypothetical protein